MERVSWVSYRILQMFQLALVLLLPLGLQLGAMENVETINRYRKAAWLMNLLQSKKDYINKCDGDVMKPRNQLKRMRERMVNICFTLHIP